MKRWVLPVVLALAACVVAPAARAGVTIYDNPDTMSPVLQGFPSDPQGAIRAARELIAAGDMQGAIRRLAAYVLVHPGEVDPRRFLGDLYFRTGDIARAQFTYEEILRFAPYDKETHNRLGTTYAEENKIDAAIAEFTSALPGTDSVNDLVALHERKGDLYAYERSVQLLALHNPTDSGIQGELGQVFYAVQQPAMAVMAYRRALDSDATNLTALNGLGLAETELRDYVAAADAFTRCLHLDPNAYQCRVNLGANYLHAGDLVDARSALELAVKMAPERGETYVNFGYLADLQGETKRAVAQYAHAMELDPYLRESYIDLALDYEQQRLYPLAQAVLLKGIASVRDDGRLHVLLGEAYEAQGDRNDAIEQFVLGSQGSDSVAASIAIARVKLLRDAAATSPPTR